MSLFPDDIRARAAAVIDAARARQVMIGCAESCTGGLVMAALTDIAGSSAAIDRGFVTYSNDAKREVLAVRAATLERFGAVSEAVAGEMIEGVLTLPAVGLALSVTGIAGPGGGTADKPVGLVHFGAGLRTGERIMRREIFAGDRTAVRLASVRTSLDLAMALLESTPAAA